MRRLAALALILAGASGLLAQAPPPVTPLTTANSAGSGPLDRLYFRSIGPATPSGRVDDLAVLESDPATFYVAMATSGVYKTTNAGTTFQPVFDNEGTGSIGAIAMAQTDPNLVWVGTGEANNRQSSSWGDGVYKSADGGRTWRNMGLRASKQVARIIVDPVDFNVVYVASPGDLWGPGGERGVYKTTDGGLTWTRSLHVDDDTGATDLVMDPQNNKTLYAATYHRRRQQWGMNGGGAGSGIWKSTDAGQTWARIETGLPAGPKGRIGLAIYRANPNVLYAVAEIPDHNGVYRTDDAGASWRKMSDTNPRPMYFSQIRVDPQTDSRIYVLGVSLHISDDGGRTFRGDGAERIHVDHHAMWINPANPKHLVIGNDGGVSISHDRSATWVWMPNLLGAQSYHVEFDMQTPYHVCTGLQDNNTWCGPSAVRTNSGIINDDWYVVNGGDGFQPLMDPTDSRIVYAESQDGRMSRIDRTTNERLVVRPEPAEQKPGDTSGVYRFNWDTAMQLSPFDPATIYIGANMVLKSTDRGRSYQPISPDLTTNTDREALSIMGVAGKDVRIAKNDGVGSFGNIVTLEESAAKQGVVWVGSDDGIVSVTQDAGKTWTNATAKMTGVPKFTYVADVLPSRAAAGTAYVAFDGHRGGDYNTYVFVTTDFGATWKSIAANLPTGEVARGLAEDRKNPDVLYLGTETGLWVSLNRGGAWMRIKANLPTMPIYEIKQHPRDNDLILATHARGIWILDDVSPIQQWAKSAGEDSFVFDSEGATIMNVANDQMKGFEGDRLFLGQNPVAGATIAYRLKAEAKDVKIVIKDGSGTVVRELSGDATRDRNKAGLNLLKWDLRVQPLRPLPPPPGAGAAGGAGGGGFGGGGNNGPYVLPGTYKATLNLNGRDAQTIDVTVKGDPQIQITDADRKIWHDTAKDLHNLQAKANDVAEMVQNAFAQVGVLQQQTRGATLSPNVKQQLDGVVKEFEAVRRRLGLGQQVFGGGGGGGNTENVRGRIGQLKGAVMSATTLPTNTQLMQIRETKAALPGLIDQANAVVAKVPGLVKDMVGAGALFPAVKPVQKG
ncbi:MAG: glycosyl hydrolase [Acidobacterium sp.]|nr:glycosyl hydrolase [Acidobacteriota bacterium]PHY08846.1 MAG: glycosyl hydrolase [Acidobacterium sp.]